MKSWTEISISKLRANILSLRSSIASTTEIIYVVKANAYGHGVKQIVEAAWTAGVRWYALAHVSEAVEVRAILPDAKILIIGPVGPAEACECAEHRLVPVIAGLEHAMELSRKAAEMGTVIECHAKIDTGMGRLGIRWEEAARVLKEISGMSGIERTGICTHFASSDGESRAFFDEQRLRFGQLIEELQSMGIEPGFTHVSNSGAVLLEPDADWDAVRPGLMLYGYGPERRNRNVRIEPVLQWKARVSQVRSIPAGCPVSYNSTYLTREATSIAVLDVGYADGYPRALSNRGKVLIRGRRMPVVGNVTMSLIMVDAGAGPDVAAGDEAVLIGQQGSESIWADELAGLAGTITYEILTGIKPGEIKVVE
jgi:alanine racemase